MLPRNYNDGTFQRYTLYMGGWTDDQIAANECANRIINRAREYRRLFGVNLTALGHVIRQEVEKEIREATNGKA
jgi:hypothetical protein